LGRSTNDGVSDPATDVRIEPQREAAGSLTPSFVCKVVGSESVQLLRERCGMAVTTVMPQPSRRWCWRGARRRQGSTLRSDLAYAHPNAAAALGARAARPSDLDDASAPRAILALTWWPALSIAWAPSNRRPRSSISRT